MGIHKRKIEEEFFQFFKELQKQETSFYTNEQLIQLKSYEILLYDCFLWKRRALYFNLFDSFNNYHVSGDDFASKLISISATHIAEFYKLMKNLEINLKFFNEFDLDFNAFGFADIIDLGEQYCEAFVSDELLLEIGGSRKNGEINEAELHKRIKEILD